MTKSVHFLLTIYIYYEYSNYCYAKDIHWFRHNQKSWTVSIQTDLFFHKTYSLPSVSEDLYQYLERTFPNHEVHLVYEAGCCGFSVARYFLNLGWNVLVVNPADVKTGDKERYQKTDALDSKNLSNQLKAGVLKGIYIPTEEHEQQENNKKTAK